MKGQIYNALIVTTANDYKRLQKQYHRIVENLQARALFFVGNKEVGDLVKRSDFGGQVGFIDENDILPFASVHTVMTEQMQSLLQGKELSRGVTGWYYQQFLKMQYARICKDEYYLVWDGDTIPCGKVSMFSEESGLPYLDLKREYHAEYFVTMDLLFSGMKKCIEKSFISEHMLFNCNIMKQMISDIEKNVSLQGDSFWEKIIRSIDAERIQNSSFSEFETYGTYVATKYPTTYMLRNWYSFRLAGQFFDSNTITDDDYEWLSKDFSAISFEKGHTVREDHKNLFDNKKYQEKLSARQMLEIAQKEYKEGYIEVWDEPMESTDERISKRNDSVKIDSKEYEIYERLGDDLVSKNVNQAYLCYENAEYLCHNHIQKKLIAQKKQCICDTGLVSVQKVAIIIISYNNIYLMQKCLESIREHCAPDSYSIVIVDNASTDGVAEWLKRQPDDVVVVLSDENLGFPVGCNVGIGYAAPEQDIFLLNNDTRMTHNALFWLRMGLYENEHIGATGCVANYCGIDQLEDVEFLLPGDYVKYAEKVNIPCEHPYEEKNKLGGFGMLIKRHVLDEVGGLDEAFSPGYFEDDDISMRIHVAGYRLLVCHNSFIYHAGSQSFIKRNDLQEIFDRNHNYMIEKWGYDNLTYSAVFAEEFEQIKKITHKREDFFRVLEVGAGSGNALARVKYMYPHAEVVGVEDNALVVRDAVESIPILNLDWKKERLPFVDGFFDYIIYNDRLGINLPKELVDKVFARYLKADGKIFFVF